MIFCCLHTILIFANFPVRSQRQKNVLISWYRYFLSTFGTIAINHINLIKFGVYHTELLLLWVSKSGWQETRRIKVFIFWLWTLSCCFHTVEFYAIAPESCSSEKVLISQFWARFCSFHFFPLIIFNSVSANLTYIISYFSSPVKFWYYCYKSYQIDQIRRLSYWVNTIVSVKTALTSNYAHKSIYLLILDTLMSFPYS